MSRVDWSKVSLEIKENIFLDLYNVLEFPCEIEGFICPMNSYGLDCDEDNDNHCLEIRK